MCSQAPEAGVVRVGACVIHSRDSEADLLEQKQLKACWLGCVKRICIVHIGGRVQQNHILDVMLCIKDISTINVTLQGLYADYGFTLG